MIQFNGPITLPSGTVTNHHVIETIELRSDLNAVVLRIASWGSITAKENGYAAERGTISMAFGDFPGASALIDSLKVALTAPGGALQGAAEHTEAIDLEEARKRMLAQITNWRSKANEVFSHQSLEFSADALSWKDITGIQGHRTKTDALPSWWFGAWKAINNSYLSITTAQEWDDFYEAALAQGAANFARSEALKAYVNNPARTVEEVGAVTWDMEIV